MKMMKGIVAAAITSATFLCFGGVQVTKQYCDSNRDKAVQNAIESVQTALPSLVGAAVDNYMADNGIPTVQTNTVVIEKFHTNNVSTVTNRYVVTRETNIVQNVQTNITVNHSEEYRTVIDASDRIVSTNGNEITTIFAQNKKIERDTISTITTTFPSNLWSSNCGAKYDKTNLLQVSNRYNTYGYPNVIDQTYVNELHQDGGSLVLQGVFIPIQTYTIINGIINDGVTQYMKIGFVVQGGWTSISDGRTNYITSATSPKIGDVLISSKQSNYYYSDTDERFTFSTSPSTTTWTNLNDPTLNPTTYRFFCYLWSRENTSSQSDYFVFRNYTATSTETVHSRKVDELVAFGELPDYIAGVSANNIITNDKFKTQVDSALNVITAPVITRATTAAQRAEAVVMNQEATVSNMSNYWDSTKSYYDSQVSTISGHRNAAVQAANNARAYESSAEAAASSAQTAYGNTVNAANSGIAQINERIAWFDEYSGKTITQINITSNNYYAEDTAARAMASNAATIASSAMAIAETNKDDIAELNEKIANVKAEGANLIEYANAKKYCIQITTTIPGIPVPVTSVAGVFSAGSKYEMDGSTYVYSIYGNLNMNFGITVDSMKIMTISGTRIPVVVLRNSYNETVNVVFQSQSSIMLPSVESGTSEIYINDFGTRKQATVKIVYCGVATDKFDGTITRYISANLGIYNVLTGLKEDELAKLSMLNSQFLALSNWVERVFQKK